MSRTVPRRTLLQLGGRTVAALGAAAWAGRLNGDPLLAQSLPTRSIPANYTEDFFYREDWLGEPWLKPEPVVLIHGSNESSTEWYAWIPRMAQEYRVFRPDLPGCGHATVPKGFQYTLQNLAGYVVQVMDKAGIESAHIVGAKTGGATAMWLAADHPKRVKSLVVAGGPASQLEIANPSRVPQLDRLGSHASKGMIEYWNMLLANRMDGSKGLAQAMNKYDLAKEGVLQRITAPTMVITADRTKMHSVEKARAYQVQIKDSRLVVIRSDAYHIAVANADECLTHTLSFLKELHS